MEELNPYFECTAYGGNSSYKTIAMEAKDVPQVKFVWFTDGIGWQSAKHNLEETFDVLEHIYNIADMENGIMQELFV